MQVTDRPSPDGPSLTQAIIVQMVYCKGGGSWEKVHSVQIFIFCFLTDSYGEFNKETSAENHLKNIESSQKLRHFL